MPKRKIAALISDIVVDSHPDIILLREVPHTSLSCQPPHDAEWRNAVLRRLQRQSGGGGQGMLYCHPSLQSDVADWLRQHPHLGWDLVQDATLTEQRVRLSTLQGETIMRWQATPLSSVR